MSNNISTFEEIHTHILRLTWLSCFLSVVNYICASVILDFSQWFSSVLCKCSPVSIPFISLWTPSFIKRQPTDWDKRPSRKLDCEVPPGSLKASASNRPSKLGSYQRYLPLGSATCACVCERDLASQQAPLYTSICEFVHAYPSVCVSICPRLAQDFCMIFTDHLQRRGN